MHIIFISIKLYQIKSHFNQSLQIVIIIITSIGC